ncbi:hypothetical protein Baya_5775 [Bagarius yarrelli]|uniref:Uncharacterized protein n=1 Tax=Bagarius yarrelli TaxID=175774 RepID=A0A556TYJ3_BAGYA|nr:hypothetical protein Baya_5775 [Bagarius yarrelli]
MSLQGQNFELRHWRKFPHYFSRAYGCADMLTDGYFRIAALYLDFPPYTRIKGEISPLLDWKVEQKAAAQGRLKQSAALAQPTGQPTVSQDLAVARCSSSSGNARYRAAGGDRNFFAEGLPGSRWIPAEFCRSLRKKAFLMDRSTESSWNPEGSLDSTDPSMRKSVLCPQRTRTQDKLSHGRIFPVFLSCEETNRCFM